MLMRLAGVLAAQTLREHTARETRRRKGRDVRGRQMVHLGGVVPVEEGEPGQPIGRPPVHGQTERQQGQCAGGSGDGSEGRRRVGGQATGRRAGASARGRACKLGEGDDRMFAACTDAMASEDREIR